MQQLLRIYKDEGGGASFFSESHKAPFERTASFSSKGTSKYVFILENSKNIHNNHFFKSKILQVHICFVNKRMRIMGDNNIDNMGCRIVGRVEERFDKQVHK